MTADAQLRDYQLQGVDFLRGHARAFLGDEAGLGKSAQLLRATDGLGRCAVVAPAMVLAGGTWTDETARWAADPAAYQQIAYSKLGVYGTKPPTSTDGKLIPWSRGPNKWDKLLRPEIPAHLDAVVFDEAHYLKGRDAARSHLGMALAARADRVYLASGTPIPNYSYELFPLLQLLEPDEARPGGRLGSYWNWVEEWFHVTPGQFSYYDIGGMRGCTVECLERPATDPCAHFHAFARANLADRFLRRLRDDVLTDLPPLTQIEVETPMGKNQLAAYRKMKKDMLAEFADGRTVVAWSEGAKHVMLDRIATGMDLIDIDATGRPTADNGKLARLAQDLADRSRPTLVAAHYQVTCESCLDVARGLGLKAELIYGPTPAGDREKFVRQFQRGELDVLVGSLETLAEGLTLVSADMIIFVEKSWKPSRNEQMLRRVHRLGQTRPVTALDYVTPRSVDAAKRKLLARKTDDQMRTLSAADLVQAMDLTE